MLQCEKCGKWFERLEAEGQFYSETSATVPISYEQLQRELCGDCAVEAYESGQYFERCEFCGEEFYPEDEKFKFDQFASRKFPGTHIYQFGICCAQCTIFQLYNPPVKKK